jgi:hypothetical protein
VAVALGSLWRRITRALTPPGTRAPRDGEPDVRLESSQADLDKARLDTLRDPDQRIQDWQAPMDDH